MLHPNLLQIKQCVARCLDYCKIQTMKAVNFTLIHSFNTPPLPLHLPPPGGWNVLGVVVAIR